MASCSSFKLWEHHPSSKRMLTSSVELFTEFPFSPIHAFLHVCLDISSAWSFPGGSDGKASACNAGDPGLIPGLGRSPGEGNGNPLQYSCLENSMDGGITVHGIAESDMTK